LARKGKQAVIGEGWLVNREGMCGIERTAGLQPLAGWDNTAERRGKMKKGIKTENKQWQKPELVVLVRSKPEEAVLTSCKVMGGSGYHGTNNGCMWESLCQSVCSSIDPS
jgi:hypothetical protein